MHYLDNSATTRVSPSVAAEVNRLMTEVWGNPSSLHSLGIRAEEELSRSRAALAKELGADTNEIYFTSGGTEANNLAVFGAAGWLKRRGNRVVTTAVEHSSVYEAMKELEARGFEVVYISPDYEGRITAEKLAEAIDKNTILVSVMYVNNEVGAVFPIDRLRKIIDRSGAPALLHCDCVQAFGKIPVKVKRLGLDIATVSGHKIHAPKGVGAIYVRKGLHLLPQHFGGEQEKKLRPGTEPLPLIAGFAQAVRDINLPKSYNKVSELSTYARERLSSLDGIIFNSPADALPYILNFSVSTIRSETVLHFLAEREIYVSSGSACAKGKPSHVMSAMGLEKGRADSAIRVSFSEENSKDDVDALVSALSEAIDTLVKR